MIWRNLIVGCTILSLVAGEFYMKQQVERETRQLAAAQQILTEQTKAIVAIHAASEARINEATTQLLTMKPFDTERQNLAHQFIVLHPSGATACDRAQQVDRAFVKTLKAEP